MTGPRPTERVLDLAARDDLGLAPHYLVLWAVVVGLEAVNVLEFGAGGSTFIVGEALAALGARRRLLSCSMEPPLDIVRRYGPMPPGVVWEHRRGLSSALALTDDGHFDLILHDGAHAADVVEADLRLALPHLRRFGLVLVHDTQHSYVGGEMRDALRALHTAPPCALSSTTFPYGFGLTILRREDGDDPIHPTRGKVGSSHSTRPETIRCP